MRNVERTVLRVGVVMMALALTFAAAAAVITLRAEPQRVAAVTKEPSVPVVPLSQPEPPQEPPEEAEPPQPEPPQATKPETETKPEPAPPPEPGREPLQGEGSGWPMPTEEQLRQASGPRRYELPDGAIMGLTVNALDLHNVPVFNSDSKWALDNGVSHEPGTSMPWSRSKQKNVYLQGHRFGWPGTESHLVFYRLDRLKRGDEILLKDRDGDHYRYRVREAFVVEPNDSWVMGRARGRDMVTLQTCTPIPRLDKRLIVRADRV